MITTIEKLGDRLLGMVVPQAHASACDPTICCSYIGDCDVNRLRYHCCSAFIPIACYTTCNHTNPACFC
jgi:hypothetical protein